MAEQLTIKNKTIGSGKPLICVSIMEREKEEIVKKAAQMAAQSVDMIEWRVDAFSKADNLNAIREVLEALAPVITDTIFVYTFRSKNQGGLLALSQEQIADIHEIAAESGVCDFVDVEFFEAKNAPREIRHLRERGIHVIASHHDFSQTPGADVMEMLLEQMYKNGADVVKLAVMPQSAGDVLALLQQTNRFREAHKKTPIITMAMGPLGSVSRVAGEAFGSCVTFGAFDRASAPGQLPYEKLKQVLSILHEAMRG